MAIFFIILAIVIVLTFSLYLIKSQEKFNAAYNKAEAFIRVADGKSQKDARDATLLIEKAHHLAFEATTYSRISELYSMHKEKFKNILNDPL